MPESKNGSAAEEAADHAGTEENSLVEMPPIVLQRLGEKDLRLAVVEQENAQLRAMLAEKDIAIESLRVGADA